MEKPNQIVKRGQNRRQQLLNNNLKIPIEKLKTLKGNHIICI